MSNLTFDTLFQPNGPDFNVYAPDIFGATMYMGGWSSIADIGPDRLYQSSCGVDAPVALTWNGAAPTDHVNDPSVIRIGSILDMYVTILPNQYGLDASMMDHNITGRAISTDNGATWTWAGTVIGQWNGLANTGAWAPSAIETAHGPTLWYNTGLHDTITGAETTMQVYRSQLNSSGASVTATAPCVRSDTGLALEGANVSVTQATDGTYWLVANDYINYGFDVVAYTSSDGFNWTPWQAGNPVLIQANGATLFTPTISSISATDLNVVYSEKLPAQTVQHVIDIKLNDDTAPNFFVSTVYNGAPSQPVAVTGEVYRGPVAGLASDYIAVTSQNLNAVALTDNVFICSGDGNDALVAKGGYNVLNGGGGSNFLTAGTGNDTFFSSVGGPTDLWSTIVGFRPGCDDVTIWNLLPGTAPKWLANQGAGGFLGATIHISESNGCTSSLTLVGFSVAQASSLTFSTGTTGGVAYTHF